MKQARGIGKKPSHESRHVLGNDLQESNSIKPHPSISKSFCPNNKCELLQVMKIMPIIMVYIVEFAVKTWTHYDVLILSPYLLT